jgi:hypothetical protein
MHNQLADKFEKGALAPFFLSQFPYSFGKPWRIAKAKVNEAIVCVI